MRTKILHIGLIAAMGLLAACGSSPRAPHALTKSACRRPKEVTTELVAKGYKG